MAQGRPPRSWNTPEVVARLGKVPDAQIAEELGLSIHTIRSERVRRGIRMQISLEREKFDRLLGIISDADLARLKGVSRQAVTSRRKTLGVDACHDASALALLLVEVRDRATENAKDVSIPMDLYERICDHLSR